MPPKITDSRPNPDAAVHTVEEQTASGARRIVSTYAEDLVDGVTLMCMLGIEPQGLVYKQFAEDFEAEIAEAEIAEAEEEGSSAKKATKKASKKKSTKKAAKKKATKKTAKKASKKKSTKKTAKKAAKKTTKKAAKKSSSDEG